MNGSMDAKRKTTLDDGSGASNRERFAFSCLMPLSAALVSIVLLTGIIGGFELLIGLTINGWESVLAAVVTFSGLAVWMQRIHGKRWWAAWIALVILVVLLVVPNLVLVGRVLDCTWDGQWFHQEAVIQLAEGWNPFRAELGAAEVADEGARVRINGYPKASWLWGASLYRLTHRIERAKAFSFPLMIAAGLAVLAVLLLVTALRPLTALFVAVVVAANPMALVQILNAYHDGAMASLLTICAASLVLWVVNGSRVGLVMATASAVGVSAIKLTGPLYVAIFVIAAVGWQMWFGRWRGERRVFGISLLAAAAGLTLLSGGTYLSNTVHHGHPMYPILGPDRVEIFDAPPHNRFQGLLASVLSRSSSTTDDYESIAVLQEWAKLKLPFTFDRGEVAAFFNPWVRIGGWGPLFSGVVVLTVVLIGLSAFRRPRQTVVGLLVIAPVVLSVLVNPGCWKFRYAPQSWIVPLIIAILVLTRSRSGFHRTLAGVLVIIAGINCSLVAAGHFPAVVAHSANVKHRLLDLQQHHRVLKVDFYPFRSNRVRLAELGIDFAEVEDRRYNLPIYLGITGTVRTRLDVTASPGGGRVAAVGWTPSAGVEEYRLEVLAPRPTGPGGSVLSLFERRTSELETVLPLPSNAVTLVMTICNSLGCGAAYAFGVVEAGGEDRERPVMGSPGEGAVLKKPTVVFSWIPAASGPDGVSPAYRFRLEDAVTGEVIVDDETSKLWLPHCLSEDGEWLARVGLAGADVNEMDGIRFRTEWATAPKIIRPASGSVFAGGTIELEWERIGGVSAYEYFVAVEGEPQPVVRGVSTTTTVSVGLEAMENAPVRYSAIVRACFAEEGCASGAEYGWGPWTVDAGLGDVKIIVRPAPAEESSNLDRDDAGG